VIVDDRPSTYAVLLKSSLSFLLSSMGVISFLVTLSVLCIGYIVLVYADEEVYGDEGNNLQSSEAKQMIFLLCFFSTWCYNYFLKPFVFGPRLKRHIEGFKLNGVRTEATLLSQSKLNQTMARYLNTILVRFTNTRGQWIEKEMHVDDKGMFLEIERGNLKTLTIYTMPNHPFSASFGDIRHVEYSLMGKILHALVALFYAACGVYCFVIYFTYFDSIAGFIGMIVMHLVMAVFSYFRIKHCDYIPIRKNLYEGGSIVSGEDPTQILGVSNAITPEVGGYNELM
jgi:hypothetical protein